MTSANQTRKNTLNCASMSAKALFIHSFSDHRIRWFLAIPSNLLQLSLSLMAPFQFLSSLSAYLYTSFYHLFLGCPLGLFLCGHSHTKSFFGSLPVIHFTCHNHLSLLILTVSTMLGSLLFWSSSSLFSILHSFTLLSNTGPNILLDIFLSKTFSCDISFFVRLHASDP